MTKLEDCDINALCHIVERCQPLLSKMDGILVTKVKSVRNKLVHCASLNICLKEMECDIDVILGFVKRLKTLDANREIEEAERHIEKLRSGRVAVLSEHDITLLHEIVSDMKLEIQYKEEEAKNLGNMGSALKRLSACEGPLHQSARGDSSLCGGSDIHTPSDQANNPTPDTPTFEVDIEVESSSSGDSDIDPTSGNQDVEHSNTRRDQQVNRFPNLGRDDSDELGDIEREKGRKKEGIERKITKLKEEKRELEEEIEEIEGHIERLKINLLEGHHYSGSFLGSVVGGVAGGVVAGLPGVVAGVKAGRKIGSFFDDAAGTLHVCGIYIDATTEESCQEGIQKLEFGVHERRQRVTYLEEEIAKQQQVLFQLTHNM